MEDIYDKMEKQDKIFCPYCETFVDKYDEWDKEYEGCYCCRDGDDEYKSYIKKRDAYDAYIDSKIDEMRGK